MIDVTVKQPNGGFGDRQGRKPHPKTRRKHDAINLPKNLSDSEDDVEDQMPSEDENEKEELSGLKEMTDDELSSYCLNLAITEQKSSMIQALIKLKAVVRKYQENLVKNHFKEKEKELQLLIPEVKDHSPVLKARSPFRNKLDEHKKNKQYNVSFKQGSSCVVEASCNKSQGCQESTKRDVQKIDSSITFPHTNLGNVFVQNLVPVGISTVASGFSQRDHQLESDELYDLVNAVQDVEFMASFQKLSEDEVEHVFNMFLSESGCQVPVHNPWGVPVRTISPVVSPPHLPTVHTPVTSPLNIDQYDSSYETGSPSSSVVPSPGSPNVYFSPAPDVEIELDPRIEAHNLKPMISVINRLSTNPLVRCVNIKPSDSPRKSEPPVVPLGEIVPFNMISATERLLKFQNSTRFCIQHFSIQLVRVIMSAKAQAASEKVDEFSKSLINTMKMKLGKKAHEGEIWQLSILAHVQFLLARVAEYKSALLVRDERNNSLLYIAAIEQQMPLVARYIAESMYKVGFNPLDVDGKGNTVLHLLADLGDSHVLTLSELLMACGTQSVHCVNKAQQTVLHAAVRTLNPHLTTVLTLLRMKANPLRQDISEKSALHYHIEQLVPRFPRPMQDVAVIRKMLQSLDSLNNECLIALNFLNSDPALPGDLKSVILEEVNKFGVKDIRMRRMDRLMMYPKLR